jgi:hypothetical protein
VKRWDKNVPTDRGIILAFGWHVRCDLCFTGRIALFVENLNFQMTIQLMRSVADSAENNYSIVGILRIVRPGILNSANSPAKYCKYCKQCGKIVQVVQIVRAVVLQKCLY